MASDDRLSPKNPWFAANLSLLWPGLGQIYAGQPWLGAGLAVVEGLVLLLAIWSILGAQGNTLLGLGLLVPLSFIYLYALFEAFRQISQVSLLEASRVHRQADPWLAVFWGQLLPGLGQVYLGQGVLGLTLLIVLFGLTVGTVFVPSLAIGPPILSALACALAYLHCDRRKISPSLKLSLSSQSDITQRQLRRYLLPVLVAVFGLRLLVSAGPVWLQTNFQLFKIPSDSMVPTLRVGDRILVRKAQHYQPHAGDLIVFRNLPNAPKTARLPHFFVKRVVAEPGQTVGVRDGRLFRDNVPVYEPYLSEPPAYVWGPVSVPSGHYAVLGDNRNDSYDSHLWGFLPADHVIGRAYKIFWPPERIRSLLPHSDPSKGI